MFLFSAQKSTHFKQACFSVLLISFPLYLFTVSKLSLENYYFWIFLNAQVRFIIWNHQKSNTKPKIREDKDHVYNKRKI